MCKYSNICVLFKLRENVIHKKSATFDESSFDPAAPHVDVLQTVMAVLLISHRRDGDVSMLC